MSGRPTGASCLVLVDKPVGPTSFDIVRLARKGVGRRVGHAGTLDPFASGLLLVMIGYATRVSSILMDLPKEYEVTVKFGAVSSTADPTGDIVATGGRTTESLVEKILERFRGRIRQRVPLTSAVKVDGEPLYRKAHRGESAETPEREVVVHDIALADFDEEAQTARLMILAGKGTYVRTIAEDLGSATGVGAYAQALRRTAVGHFSVDEALSPAELSPERYAGIGKGVFSLDDALGFLPRHDLDDREARLAANGNELPGAPIGRFRVYGPRGLLGVYEGRIGGARPLVVFPSPQ
jgi:tRNA pseudouridine55 synthase